MLVITLFRQLFFIFVFAASSILGVFFYMIHNHYIDFSVLERYHPGRPSILLDDEGNEWARFQLDRREPIDLSRMPRHLIHAFVAAEDWEFFSHYGISLKGIARSLLVNLYYGRKVQGASTITQQLVKLLFFDSRKTFSRKIQEQLFAMLVERQFTKEQILQTYLNHVYFGCGIYGVEAASQRFWAKHTYQLTVNESAMLAAIIRSPGRYCPLLCPLSAEKRRNVILGKMLRLDFISQTEYEYAYEASLHLREYIKKTCAPHLKESIRLLLEEEIGKATLYSAGLCIQTTINHTMQQEAEHIFKKECERLKKELGRDVDGALIAMDVKTGEIKALVGGYDFHTSKFNRVHARRQMGSIFKPLIYAAALQEGMTLMDTEIDEPLEVIQDGKAWRPKNHDQQFNGQITLAYALSHSNNIIAIKTLLHIGMHNVISLAKKCHITGPFHPYPSLALGCVDATIKEAIGMFNVFANHGTYVEPHYLRWVKNKWGTKIYRVIQEHERVMSSRISGQVGSVLRLGVERVRKFFKNQWPESEVISKTGTTNKSRTCWFIGSTPTLTTALYIGCDDNQSMGVNIYPIRTALPIWLAFNKKVEGTKKTFSYDPSLCCVTINEYTGKRVRDLRDKEAITILV